MPCRTYGPDPTATATATSMLKKLLSRFLGRPPAPPEPEELPLSPLTVLAVEPQPQPRLVEMIDVDNLYFPWLLGMGTAEPQDLNDAENRILRALKREADTADPAIADLVPRIPSIIPMLLRSLRDSNISSSELAAQVSQDPVLVAAVLRQVNSSYFRRSSAVKTIEEAVNVIGQNGLRMLVAGAAFKPLFNTGLGHFTKLGAPRIWEMTEPGGIACHYLAGRRHVDGFEVYLSSLLQNVGVIVALRVMDHAGGANPGELRSFGFYASFVHYTRRLARLVGTQWEFPAHSIAATERATPDSRSPLADALHLADRTVKIRALVRNHVLREDQADACLEGDDVVACYDELVASEAAG